MATSVCQTAAKVGWTAAVQVVAKRAVATSVVTRAQAMSVVGRAEVLRGVNAVAVLRVDSQAVES